METFEYKTVTVDCKDVERSQDALTAQLNRWGKEGWELTSSLTLPIWAAHSIPLWALPIGSR